MSEAVSIIAAVITGICTIVAAFVASMRGREKTIHSKSDQSDSDSLQSSTPPTPPNGLYASPPKPPARRRIYFRAFIIIVIGFLISFFVPYPLSWVIIFGIAIWQLLSIIRSVKH